MFYFKSFFEDDRVLLTMELGDGENSTAVANDSRVRVKGVPGSGDPPPVPAGENVTENQDPQKTEVKIKKKIVRRGKRPHRGCGRGNSRQPHYGGPAGWKIVSNYYQESW